MQIPPSNLRPNRLHRLVRDCWTEVDEELSLAILRSPGPKCIAEKIELFVRICPSPVLILAIDDLRLFRMKFQFRIPRGNHIAPPENAVSTLLRSQRDQPSARPKQ